jgi:hypothetical protein
MNSTDEKAAISANGASKKKDARVARVDLKFEAVVSLLGLLPGPCPSSSNVSQPVPKDQLSFGENLWLRTSFSVGIFPTSFTSITRLLERAA